MTRRVFSVVGRDLRGLFWIGTAFRKGVPNVLSQK